MRGGGLLWLGLVSAALGALAVWHFTGKPRSPRLTTAALISAKSLWAQAGLRDYSMNITVGGRENARHQIVVANGKVSQMQTDSIEAPKRVWDFWTVDGLFTVLEEEVVNAQSPQRAFGVTDPKDVFLDASFDPVTGVPLHYLRQISGRSQATLEWKIKLFR